MAVSALRTWRAGRLSSGCQPVIEYNENRPFFGEKTT
jgi:hypothetical protein